MNLDFAPEDVAFRDEVRTFIADRASDTRSEAARQARRAGPDVKAKLTAERDGVCQSYLS